MTYNEFEFQIQVHGHPIREYLHEGRTYVEGRKGSEYKLHVRNHSASRVLAVVTVDGLSVMDGSVGDYSGKGYVIEPRASIAIPGWRLDNSEVAKFVFGSKPESYASKTGRPQNVGVIGCAVFKEIPQYNWAPYVPPQKTVEHHHHHYHDHWPYRPWRPYSPWNTGGPIWACDNTSDSWTLGNATSCSTVETPQVACYNASEEPLHGVLRGQSLGTGFGEAAEHRVEEVSFTREASPSTVFEVWYDDRMGLEARGIDLRGKLKIGRPTAFPNRGGCRPPKGWTR